LTGRRDRRGIRSDPEAVSGSKRFVVDVLQLGIGDAGTHMGRKAGYVVKDEFGNPGDLGDLDPEEVDVLDVVQDKGGAQVFPGGADLDVVELNAIDVADIEAV